MQHQLRRARDERGAQAVEFALIFTFALGPLIYGIIAFGIILNTQLQASQYAREATRTAAICWGQPTPSASKCDTDPTSTTSGQYRYNQAAGTAGTFSGVTVAWTDNCGGPSGSFIQGTVKVNAPLGLALFGLPTVPVTGKATTPCGG